jgi:predicted DsbA family dithiol-disulfide isomerase
LRFQRSGPRSQTMASLSVEIWSDIACPWCYIGKRRLESALARFEHRGEVEIHWRAFELDPSAPPERQDGAYVERLARKYGASVSEAQAMIDRMASVARIEGLSFDFERIRPGNTFDAHRLIHLGKERRLEDRVKERLLRAYLEEGEAIGSRETLQRLAEECGLVAGEVRELLDGERFAAEVRADEEQAVSLRITGVPFFVLGGRYAISGAQPADILLEGLVQAYQDVVQPRLTLEEGTVCGPDGCEAPGVAR